MADTSTGATNPESGFFARWSARKGEAREGTEPDAPAQVTAERGEPLAGEDPGPDRRTAEQQPTDADMPPLDTLDGHSDYSAFLSPEVSDTLRRRALSQLFHSPHLNVTDGLDDYAEDFTRFVSLGNVLTADLRHRLEQASEHLLEDEEAGAPEREAAPTVAQHEGIEPSASPDRNTPLESPAEADTPSQDSGEHA